MADAALYYPYIEVPGSATLTRVLLYWDELGTIVPAGIGNDPLGERTRELVRAGLVRPVSPGRYWQELEGFAEGFLRLIQPVQGRLRGGDGVLIHRDKATGMLWGELQRRRLARESRRQEGWYYVEPGVGALFMAYLAARLSQVSSLQMEPITDQREYFRDAGGAPEPMDTALLFDHMRGAVLDGVLPSPREHVGPRELAQFKAEHWDALGSFRRLVESRLLECARESQPEIRVRMVAQVKADIEDGVADIGDRLRHQRWTPATGTLCVAIAAAPAVIETAVTRNPFPASGAAAARLAELLRQTLMGGRQKIPGAPLAYAALAQQRFQCDVAA
jgi:hypothetical protein